MIFDKQVLTAAIQICLPLVLLIGPAASYWGCDPTANDPCPSNEFCRRFVRQCTPCKGVSSPIPNGEVNATNGALTCNAPYYVVPGVYPWCSINPFWAIGQSCERCVDYSVFNSTYLKLMFKMDTRVFTGRDFFKNNPRSYYEWPQGVVVGGLDEPSRFGDPARPGEVVVRFPRSRLGYFNLGKGSQFDLCRRTDVGRSAPGDSILICETVNDFDTTDILGYKQSTTDNFNWIQSNGPSNTPAGTPTTNSIPAIGLNGRLVGQFMYIDGSSQSAGNQAVLLSPIYTTLESTCTLSFSYYMHTGSNDNLALSMLFDGVKKQLWSKTGSQGSGWKKAIIPWGAVPSFQLVFNATVSGHALSGDIAIDHVSFSQCSCPCHGTVKNGVVNKNDGSVTCNKGYHFEQSDNDIHCSSYGQWENVGRCQRCVDYSVFNSTYVKGLFTHNEQVVRGEDWSWGRQGSNTIGNITQGLGMQARTGWISVAWANNQNYLYRAGYNGKFDVCRVQDLGRIALRGSVLPCSIVTDFETPIQSYNQSAKGAFNWTRSSGRFVDHTIGTMLGHYMYADGSSQHAGDQAVLVSPMYTTDSSNCSLSFWYHMHGPLKSKLSMSIRINGVTKELWSKVDGQTQGWLNARYPLGAVPSFQLVFTATVNGDGIAIDDISFPNCPCSCTTANGVVNTNGLPTCNFGHYYLPKLKIAYPTPYCDSTGEWQNTGSCQECTGTIPHGTVAVSGSVNCTFGYRHVPSSLYCDGAGRWRNVGRCEVVPAYCKLPILAIEDELKKVAQIDFTEMTVGYIDLLCQPWTYGSHMRIWCDGAARTFGYLSWQQDKCLPICTTTVTNGVVATSNGSVTCNIGYRHLPSTQAVYCDSNRQLHNVGTCEKIPDYCKFPIDELKKVAQINFTQMTIGYIDLLCQPWTYANGRMRMWCDGDTRTSGRYSLEKGKCIPAGCSSLPISAYTCYQDQYWDPYLNMHVPVTVENGRTQGCYAKCPRGMRGSIQCIGKITDGWWGWAGNCEHDPTPCDPTDGSKFWLPVGPFQHECVKTSIKVSNTEWWYAYPYQGMYNGVCEERHQGRLSANVFSHITNTTLLDFLRPFTNNYSIYLQPTQSHPSSSSNPSKPSSIPICVASCKSNSLGPELANIYADGRYSCRSGVPLERSPRAICRKGVFRGDCIVSPSCSTINKQSITNLKSIDQTGRYQCDRGYGQSHVNRFSTCTSDGTSDGGCLKMKAYGKRILAYRLAHPHARLF